MLNDAKSYLYETLEVNEGVHFPAASSLARMQGDLLKSHVETRFRGISPIDFEKLLASLFVAMGYRVDLTPVSGDYGADLILFQGEKKTVVQIKRYSMSGSIGSKAISEVIGARLYYNANHAIFVTTSYFTRGAEKMALAADVELLGYHQLVTLIRENCKGLLDNWVSSIEAETAATARRIALAGKPPRPFFLTSWEGSLCLMSPVIAVVVWLMVLLGTFSFSAANTWFWITLTSLSVIPVLAYWSRGNNGRP